MRFILVTGASKNIGSEISKLLAKKKNNLILHYNFSKASAIALKEEIQKKVKDISIYLVKGDFLKEEKVSLFIDEIKKLQVDKNFSIEGIIHSAAMYNTKELLSSSEKDLKNIFQVNLFSIFQINKAFLIDLKKNKGFIIHLGMCGINNKKASIYAPIYQMSKSTLFELTKSLALTLSKDQIRVNMVSPGYSETSMDKPKDIGMIPMKRFVKNYEIARLVLFLINDKYITGQNIEIAGGMRL